MPPPAPRVAIVGGGIMGCDIAAIFAAGGWHAHVVSPTPTTRESLPVRVGKALTALGVDPAQVARVQVHAQLEEVPWPDIQIVIEAATEDLTLKQQLFSLIETLAPPRIPLATNTSSFLIGDVGGHLATRARVLGLHFFMPAHLVPGVEVVRAVFTDPAVAERAEALMQNLGKVPIRVAKDITGFIANRLQHAMVREALSMVARGVAAPEDIDKAVQYGFGLRFLACGPMLQKEMSGWDTNYRSGSIIYPTLCNDTRPPGMFRELAAQGRAGMKTGQGLWQWNADSIQQTKQRYEQALHAALRVLNPKETRP